MPRCKHKMYCVFFFFGGGSQLIANQTGYGQVGFVPVNKCLFSAGRKWREKKLRFKWLHPKSNTVVKDKKDSSIPLDYHTRRFYFFDVLRWLNIFDDFFLFLKKQFEMQYIIILSLRQPFWKTEVIMYSLWLVVELQHGQSLSCRFNRLLYCM